MPDDGNGNNNGNGNGSGSAAGGDAGGPALPAGTAGGDTGGPGWFAEANAMLAETWSGINFVIDGKESNPGSGGGFQLNRDEGLALQKKAVKLADHYRGLRHYTASLQEMQSPADVQPCNTFTKAMTQSWEAGHSNTDQLRELWKSLAEKLGKMLGVYEQQDEQSGKDVKKSGGEDNSGGGYLG